MDYFNILNLDKEPFSNSPDPEYFFPSRQHQDCLQKLELSLRLRRGLNVVVGEVGTGKTTLCRELIRRFASDTKIETHLILDPDFNTPLEFLTFVTEMLEREKPAEKNIDTGKLKEIIKRYIFRKGVDEKKTVVIIIDEGQKIPQFCLEILREFLNYETNEYKLLQIVIFAQKEFENTLQAHANFADRINLLHHLKPLSFHDTKSMIQFRLNRSRISPKKLSVFSYPALWAIYRATQGFPRRIVNLCHQSMLAMILQNKSRARWLLVRSCVKRTFLIKTEKKHRLILISAFLFLVIAFALFFPNRLEIPFDFKFNWKENSHVSKKNNLNFIPVVIKPEVKHEIKKEPDAQPLSVKAKELTAQEPAPEELLINTFPMFLGTVSLKPGETLWRLIYRVYGSYDKLYLKSIITANPDIYNPDHVEKGQTIYLPAVPVIDNIKDVKKIWWVRFEDKEKIEDAIDVLRRKKRGYPLMRIIPYWNKTKGIRFAILLKENFSIEALAQKKLLNLPGVLASKGDIISVWEEDTIFFSDPYLDIN